jgi:hypothetical protein
MKFEAIINLQIDDRGYLGNYVIRSVYSSFAQDKNKFVVSGFVVCCREDVRLAWIQLTLNPTDNPISLIGSVRTLKRINQQSHLRRPAVFKTNGSGFNRLNNPFWIFCLVWGTSPLKRINYSRFLSESCHIKCLLNDEQKIAREPRATRFDNGASIAVAP